MKVDRLVSIIMMLLDKKRIGAQELANTFEVSPRTIYRDIEAIKIWRVFLFVPYQELAAALKLCRNTRLIKRFFRLLIFPQS